MLLSLWASTALASSSSSSSTQAKHRHARKYVFWSQNGCCTSYDVAAVTKEDLSASLPPSFRPLGFDHHNSPFARITWKVMIIMILRDPKLCARMIQYDQLIQSAFGIVVFFAGIATFCLLPEEAAWLGAFWLPGDTMTHDDTIVFNFFELFFLEIL